MIAGAIRVHGMADEIKICPILNTMIFFFMRALIMRANSRRSSSFAISKPSGSKFSS
jgi:hypothetical protein